MTQRTRCYLENLNCQVSDGGDLARLTLYLHAIKVTKGGLVIRGVDDRLEGRGDAGGIGSVGGGLLNVSPSACHTNYIPIFCTITSPPPHSTAATPCPLQQRLQYPPQLNFERIYYNKFSYCTSCHDSERLFAYFYQSPRGNQRQPT